MREALAQVKRAFGPEAVILGTRTLEPGPLGRLAGRERVEVTAAPPEAPARGPRLGSPRRATVVRPSNRPAEPPALPEHVLPYYTRLVQNEVAEELAQRLLRAAAETVPPEVARQPKALAEVLRRCIARMVPTSNGLDADGARPRRLALVGPPGSGKTTTIMKLAAQLKCRQHRDVVLFSFDLHRLGAGEYLRRYAELLQVPLHLCQTVEEVKRSVAQLPENAWVLIDTPGVGSRDQGRFARLAALLRAARPDEIHLVLPADAARSVQERAARAFEPLGPARVVITRLDEAVGLGVILNVMDRLNLELSFVSAGQNVPDDLEAACSRRLAELILPMEP